MEACLGEKIWQALKKLDLKSKNITENQKAKLKELLP